MKTKVINREIGFIRGLRNQLLYGGFLCIYLSSILIFLEPFDTDQYSSNYKELLLFGYGVLVFLIAFFQLRITYLIFLKNGKSWKIRNEFWSVFFFFLISGTILYIYNCYIINKSSYSLSDHFRFYYKILGSFIPIILPIKILLRNRLSQVELTNSELEGESLSIKGKGKDEALNVERNNLIFIKGEGNYLKIFYLENGETKHKLIRQTIQFVSNQFDFIQRTHKSYLVNPSFIQKIEGNSQNAKVILNVENYSIPLSKTYFSKMTDFLVKNSSQKV